MEKKKFTCPLINGYIALPKIVRSHLKKIFFKIGRISSKINTLEKNQYDIHSSILHSLSKLYNEIKEFQYATSAERKHIDLSNKRELLLKGLNNFNDELSICQALQENFVAIIGYARSSTTITSQIINTSHQHYIVAEANFFLQKNSLNFRALYNKQHEGFGNQISKTTYILDLVRSNEDTWYNWLKEAIKYYDFLGEKIAFTPEQFKQCSPEEFRSFYEARFFKAKFIFTIRNPLQTLESIKKLFQLTTPAQEKEHLIGWLTFITLWADMIRIFPHCKTLLCDEIGDDFISALSQHLENNFSKGADLITNEERRQHIIDENSFWYSYKNELLKIYSLIQEISMQPSERWQIEQKRSITSNNTIGTENSTSLKKSVPIGEVWVLSTALIQELKRNK